MPKTIQLPDSWADARSIITGLTAAGHQFTEYRALGRTVVEIECPCAVELPQVCPAAGYGA